MSVLLVHGDREYLCRRGGELQTDLGVLTVPDDVEPGDRIESHLGKAFMVRRPRVPDLFQHLERTGAPMMPRDIGLLIGLAGIEANDRVLDVGTGTGILAASLGRIGASVVTYERKPEFVGVARDNMELAGVDDRVEVRGVDVMDELDGLAEFDVMTLDTADAPALIPEAPSIIRSGGVIGVYSPFVEDTRKVVTAARATGLASVESYETIQREMDFDDRGSRPTPSGVGHTGFLSFGRVP